MRESSHTFTITTQQRDTILAALRLWQATTRGADTIPADQLFAIHDIAMSDRKIDPWLTDEQIDVLCERINK
jgi:hypothetical protein